MSYEAKRRGLSVTSNDILTINSLLASALVENAKDTLTEADIATLFSGKPKKGFMHAHFAEVFYYPEECMELDRYRENIERLATPHKKALAFSLLRRAMIRKMPYSRFTIDWPTIKLLRDESYSYRKYGRKRAYHNLSFKEHVLLNLNAYNSAVFDNGRTNRVYNTDTFDLLGKVSADLIYLDPPYSGTMNNYFGFYGALDAYVHSRAQEPFTNNFVNKRSALELFDKLFASLSSYKYWVLSYNNSSFPSKGELSNLLSQYASDVTIVERQHLYKVTGKEKKRRNTEYLFVVRNATSRKRAPDGVRDTRYVKV